MCVYFCISFFTKKQCTFANKNEKLIDMARNKNILLTLTTESFMVLMASMVAFRLHESVVMPMEVSVFILVAIYACLNIDVSGIFVISSTGRTGRNECR